MVFIQLTHQIKESTLPHPVYNISQDKFLDQGSDPCCRKLTSYLRIYFYLHIMNVVLIVVSSEILLHVNTFLDIIKETILLV